jgi:UDP-N-acetylglucosamine--N-acetylmuramyl-(pentapeptide) pyrophosphoryl-undecaprenol N-acetylglucosamine transferase
MKLLISAGGTGGHIFPGIAVAETFTGKDERNEVVFVGTRQGLEGGIIPRYGFKLLFIEARQFQGKNVFAKMATLIRLLQGIRVARVIIGLEKPDAILGMGGFTCVPTILAGVMLGLPTYLHEQNVEPGLANKLLSKFVRSTFISFEATTKYLKTKRVFHTGNPLRKTLKAVKATEEKKGFNIFIFGGSRGARSINESVLTLIPFMESYKNTVMFHQTGAEDYERRKKAYEGSKIGHEVFPFTDHMEKYYNLSDVVISRSGATTIFELAYFHKAAILIPYPYSAGQHQKTNAMHVASLGGAYVVENDQLSGEKLHALLSDLMRDPGLVEEMGSSVGRLCIEDAAERIIKEIVYGSIDGISQDR